MEAKKRVTLSMTQKRTIAKEKQNCPTLTNREIAKWAHEIFSLHISECTISRVLKNATKILQSQHHGDSKRFRAAQMPILEEDLLTWFTTALGGRVKVSDDLLVGKAKQLHATFQGTDRDEGPCNFSNGWLQNFKKRHGIRIRQKIMHGAAESLRIMDDILPNEIAAAALP